MSTDRTISSSGSGAPGSMVNFARTTSTTIASDTNNGFPYDDTVPLASEGVAYASLDTTITPKFATSLLVIDVFFP